MGRGRRGNSRLDVLPHEAAVPQEPRPKLHANDAKDEEDEEAQRQHVAQHGKRVQQQGDQDAHAWQHTHTRSQPKIIIFSFPHILHRTICDVGCVRAFKRWGWPGELCGTEQMRIAWLDGR